MTRIVCNALGARSTLVVMLQRHCLPVLVASLLAGCFSPSVGGDGSTGEALASSSSTSGSSDPTSTTGDATGGSEETGSTSENTSEADTSTEGVPASCGDGVVDPDEDCDDGNELIGDGCNPDCHISGEELWTATVHGGDEDRATSLSVRSDGHILAVGAVGAEDPVFSNWWRIYEPDGTAEATGDLPRDFLSLVFAREASADENEFVGVATTTDVYNDVLGVPIAVEALDGDLSPKWNIEVPSVSEFDIGRGYAHAIALPNGGVVLTGSTATGPNLSFYNTAYARRYDASGTEAWSDVIGEGLVFGRRQCFAASARQPRGGFAVLCYEVLLDGGRPRGSVVELRKFGESGILQYLRELDVVPSPVLIEGSWIERPSAPALGVGDSGSVAIAIPFSSRSNVVAGSELFVFNASGALAWSDTIVGPGEMWFRDVAVLADEGVAFAGSAASRSGSAGLDAVVTRFDDEGNELWADVQSGMSDDRYVAAEADSQGNLVLLGELTSSANGRDLVIRKLRP